MFSHVCIFCYGIWSRDWGWAVFKEIRSSKRPLIICYSASATTPQPMSIALMSIWSLGCGSLHFKPQILIPQHLIVEQQSGFKRKWQMIFKVFQNNFLFILFCPKIHVLWWNVHVLMKVDVPTSWFMVVISVAENCWRQCVLRRLPLCLRLYIPQHLDRIRGGSGKRRVRVRRQHSLLLRQVAHLPHPLGHHPLHCPGPRRGRPSHQGALPRLRLVSFGFNIWINWEKLSQMRL